MTVSLNRIQKYAMCITLMFYTFSSYMLMVEIDNMAGLGTDNMQYYELASYLPSLLFLPLFIKEILTKHQSFIVWTFITFIVTSTLSTLFNLSGISHLFYSSFLIFPMLIFYSYTKSNGVDKHFIDLCFIALITVSLRYYQIYNVANELTFNRIGVSYFPLFILPIVLMHPSKWIRGVAWMLTAIVIISSMKRGGMLAMMFSALSYILVNSKVSQNNKLKTAILAISISSVFIIIIIYIVQLFGSDIFERFLSISDDGGSGRTIIWGDIITALASTDLIHFTIGHGYLSVGPNNVSGGLSAHNDFLEIFYDFGLINVLLYCTFVLLLIFYTILSIKKSREYSAQLTMAVSTFFILSLISIVYFYFWMTFIVINIALIIGQHEYIESRK